MRESSSRPRRAERRGRAQDFREGSKGGIFFVSLYYFGFWGGIGELVSEALFMYSVMYVQDCCR